MHETEHINIYKKIKAFADEVKINHLDVYSAGSAFFMFISIIPFFIVLFSLVSYTPMSREDIMDLSALLPREFDILIQAVTAESYVSNSATLWIALVIGVWSAARGVMYITKGLNEIHDVIEMRNYFILRFWASVYTMLVVLALIILLIFGVFGKRIMDILSEHMPRLPEDVSIILSTIINFRVLILTVCLFVLFLFMYTVLPNKKVEVIYQLPGAVICAVAWWGFTKLFSLFVGIFDVFSMYGTLATAVASMFWMYCCMYILFICAEINSHFAQMIINHIRERKERRIRRNGESIEET